MDTNTKKLYIMSNPEERLKTNIATNITIYRKRKGYSKRQLAKLLGVNEKQVSRFEDPNYEFTPKTLSSLCKVAYVLEVDILDLLVDEII